jgi:hypothetical protein
MRYVALGVVAFIIAGFFDLAALQRIRYLKQSIGLVSVLLFGYALVPRSRLLLLAAPLWIFLDGLYVWIQERFFFGQMFAGYQYKKETPMLIPTPASIVRCW